MTPPPATPPPHRFLLSKRRLPSDRQTPLTNGPPRFQTPRVAPSSTPVTSTQTFARSLQRPSRHRDGISDTIDSSSQSSLATDDDHVRSPVEEVEERPQDSAHAIEATPAFSLRKRRRITISPVDAGSPSERDDTDTDCKSDIIEHAQGRDEVRSPPKLRLQEMLDNQQRPSFQRPPVFRQAEVDAAVLDTLPPAFSPQRKGARYVPGGLAAELQGWLSQVKGSEIGDVRTATTKIHVEEVRSGGRMYLVTATRAESPGNSVDRPMRIILAGEGQLTGLGQHPPIFSGSLIEILQPTWEITLDGDGLWLVACNWRVLEHKTVAMSG